MDVKLEDLLTSYLQCRSNKRNTKAALEFERDWESNLMEGENYTGEDLDTMRRLVRMIALANPLDGVEVRGNPRLWKDLPPDKSLFAVNGFPTPAQKRKGVQLDLFRCGKQIGLPIGNLTSQWFANFYLAPFDHYCKHTLGLRYYGRYVDDFFVVHSDPDCLKSLILQFKEFLSNELKARLHPNKTRLTDYHKGISFIGVTVKGSTMLSGQRIKKNTRMALQGWNELAENRKLTDEEVERFTQMMNSYLGLMRHHNSYRLRVSLLEGMSSRLRKYFCINTPDKVISWDRVRHKAWLSARRECYSRLWALRRKYPDKKFSFEELYNDICMERYLKRMGGI